MCVCVCVCVCVLVSCYITSEVLGESGMRKRSWIYSDTKCKSKEEAVGVEVWRRGALAALGCSSLVRGQLALPWPHVAMIVLHKVFLLTGHFRD